MKISVISPSFNQSAFIEKTIESVAGQSYSEKEHLIVDGGSTDGCVDIIRESERTFSHLRSVIEPDRGQADAINKGFRESDGDILTWLNTDDKYYTEHALALIAEMFQKNPDADVIYGRGMRLDPEGRPIKEAFINRNITDAGSLKASMGIFQPSLFFRRRVFEAVGGLSEDYNLQLDYEYWIRMLQAGFQFHFLDEIIGAAVVHADAKSTRDRLYQLSECISLIDEKYDSVPDEWIGRFADFFASRRDQKTGAVTLNAEEQETSSAVQPILRRLLSDDSKSLSHHSKRNIITSFDSKYFQQGLNLIASLHRTSFASFDRIFVYSLDLTVAERARLESLYKVQVVDYSEPAPEGFSDFYDPSGRAYKVDAIAGKGLDIDDGALILWMDAGLVCCSDIDEVFSLIDAKDFFITDHDDSDSWPLFNVNFLHPDACKALGASVDDLLAPQYCSALVGYKAGGAYQSLIDKATVLGRRRDIVMWPKVLRREEKVKKPHTAQENHQYRDEILADPGLRSSLDVDDIYDRFHYYGHRTQSIYSILAHRMSAPAYSASSFRKGNKASSKAAQKNWLQGADSVDENATRFELETLSGSVRLYHHRGVYTNQAGLVFNGASEPALIVGNGPSLRGFDFNLLRGKNWVGMNAAYRYWDEQEIYPKIYTCFDTVVQESHRHEIKRLIEKREEYGIAYFFLRKEFVDYWPAANELDCVFFLEDLQKSVRWFDRGKITTGSFSLYVCAFLGFSEVYILGVDLNYVEKLPEAKTEGRELVIDEKIDQNPNYFFDSYQRPGDRYNPPNRHADMHLRSWVEAAAVLQDFPINIYNANSKSAVKVFHFVNRDAAVKAIGSRHMRAYRAAERAQHIIARQDYWRRQWLELIDAQSAFTPFRPTLHQQERLAQSLAPSFHQALSLAPPPSVKPPLEKTPPVPTQTVKQKKAILKNKDQSAQKKKLLAPSPQTLPRVLLIDPTEIGNATATGELKASLFADWPEDRLFQIYEAGPRSFGFRHGENTGIFHYSSKGEFSNISKLIEDFNPEIVIYRPAPRFGSAARRKDFFGNVRIHNDFHRASFLLVRRQTAPLALWIMDDWLNALEHDDPEVFAQVERDWTALVSQSSLRLAISEPMANAFKERYGKAFEVIANGVDPKDWPSPAQTPKQNSSLKVRYAGSLARNMTLSSVRMVAEAVETLAAAGTNIEFEIKTRDIWHKSAEPHFAEFHHTSFIAADLPLAEYRRWLQGADIVVIAYNFDERSTSYTHYSLANKLPECLASGAALLAVGPADIATMSVLHKHGCAKCVTENDVHRVGDALSALAQSDASRFELSTKAQKIVFKDYNISAVRAKFAIKISELRETRLTEQPRKAGASIDETEIVASILSDRRGRDHIMIDVGAHVGSSAAYFNKLGWRIICFEPDEKNRAQLSNRFHSVPDIEIDSRAVGDTIQRDVAFYTSDESTGISGLNAFRPTHRKTAKVDVTTIEEIVRSRSLKKIDFLKIDVEGADFSVLKGIPWGAITPDVVEVEFEDAKTGPLGHNWRDMASYLSDKGYAVYISEWHPIVRYGINHDWRRVVPFRMDTELTENAWGNLLAFRNDPGLAVVEKKFAELLVLRKEKQSKMTSGKPAADLNVKDPNFGNRPAYAEFGDMLRLRSPRLFGLLQLLRRVFARLWRRKLLIAPLGLVFAALFLSGFLPVLYPYRGLLWGAMTVSALSAGVAYLGLWTYVRVRTLSAETASLRNSVEILKRSQRQADQRVESKLNGLREGVNSNLSAAKSQLEIRLNSNERTIAKFDGIAQSIQNQLREQADANSSLASRYDSKMEQIREKIVTAFDAQNEQVTAMLSRTEIILEDLMRSENDIGALLTTAREVDEDMQSLEAELGEARENRIAVEKKFASLKGEAEELKERAAQLPAMEERANTAEAKIDFAEKRRVLSENNLSALENKYAELTSVYEDQQKRIKEIHEKLSAARDHIKVLSGEASVSDHDRKSDNG